MATDPFVVPGVPPETQVAASQICGAMVFGSTLSRPWVANEPTYATRSEVPLAICCSIVKFHSLTASAFASGCKPCGARAHTGEEPAPHAGGAVCTIGSSGSN